MNKIMIVDDEPIAVESIAVMIKRNFPGQFEVICCRSGKMAIEKAAELNPDIIIMDIDMPGINGLDAIKRIKEANGWAEFIILSAFDYFSYAQEAVSSGVVEYLLKPVKEEKLVDVLRGVLAGIEEKNRKRKNSLEQQERLLMSIPVLEHSFCVMLCTGNALAADLEKTCAMLGYENTGGYILLFRVEGQLDIRAFGIKQKLNGNIIMDRVGNEIVMYVFCKSADARPASGITEQFKKYAAESGVAVECGAGGFYAGVGAAGRSYLEAEAALPRNENAYEQKNIAGVGNIIEKTKQYIMEHYAEPLTLEEVAGRANLSQYYFSRLFKQETGTNFSDFLTSTRIENSQKLLILHELSVKEIAYMVGFNDPNYFSKAFKRATGKTPGEFKSSGREV